MVSTPCGRVRSCQAEAEALETRDWYEGRRPGLGAEFRAALEETVERIVDNPLQFRFVRGKTQRALLNRFPYAVYFRVADNDIVVLAVHLGWLPDVRSIRPILAALSGSLGALTREQLLFDLNMILMAEGAPADAKQSNALAAEHLKWLYEQLANQEIDSDIRSTVLAQRTIAVFPGSATYL